MHRVSKVGHSSFAPRAVGPLRATSGLSLRLARRCALCRKSTNLSRQSFYGEAVSATSDRPYRRFGRSRARLPPGQITQPGFDPAPRLFRVAIDPERLLPRAAAPGTAVGSRFKGHFPIRTTHRFLSLKCAPGECLLRLLQITKQRRIQACCVARATALSKSFPASMFIAAFWLVRPDFRRVREIIDRVNSHYSGAVCRSTCIMQ